MKFIWNQNPLATVVELDEHDKRILRLRIEVDCLRNRIEEAHFDLNSEDRAWHNKAIKERTLEEAVDAALKALDLTRLTDEKLDQLLAEYVSELASEHCGDCTCVACSCSKCRAEELVGTNTTEGLGKHEGSYISGIFAPKVGAPARTLAEAIEHLRDYKPTKGEAWAKYTDEEFNQYVPRWTAEAKRAHAWLVAYQAAHFASVE